MKLSTRARYGMRALVAVARNGNATITAEALAKRTGVSKKYLDAILGKLKRAGILEAERGAGGGYRLARAPARVSCADVVDALDEGIDLVPCVSDERACERSARCPTRPAWRAAALAVREALDRVRLADLAGAPAEEAETLHSI
jgi:Rrf2 family protein